VKEMNEVKTETIKPNSTGYVPLGVGKGIKWTLWDNAVTIQRTEKKGDNWETTEEFHVAPSLLKEFFWRIPHWLSVIDQKMLEKKEF
jgi:hypothetical protein